MTDWPALAGKLKAAGGPDPALDALLAEAFGVAAEPYTGSAEACRRLLDAALPGWHLHLGFGVSGLFPYAAIDHGGERVEAETPTVPLAILLAVVEEMMRKSDDAV